MQQVIEHEPLTSSERADVLERLRRHKQAEDDRMAARGVLAGRQWAVGHARLQELESLDFHDSEASLVGESIFGLHDSSGNTQAEKLYFCLRPWEDGHRDGSEMFWEDVEGEDKGASQDVNWLRGFVAGALAVWWEVKDEV